MEVDMTPQDDRPTTPDLTDLGPEASHIPAGAYEPTEPDLADVPDVDESQIRSILKLIGTGAHITMGHPAIEEHWRFTDSELDQLAPPITSWVNRSTRLKAAAQHGDAITIAVALGFYTSRNLRISREVSEQEADEAQILDEQFPPDEDGPPGMQPWGEVP
jgi:hypothetical protein